MISLFKPMTSDDGPFLADPCYGQASSVPFFPSISQQIMHNSFTYSLYRVQAGCLQCRINPCQEVYDQGEANCQNKAL